MFKKSVTPEELVEFLNSLLETDNVAITSMFSNRVPCSKEMVDHPTVQVMSPCTMHSVTFPQAVQKNWSTVSMLGILNGLFGVNQNFYGCIKMNIDNMVIQSFEVDYNMGNPNKEEKV